MWEFTSSYILFPPEFKCQHLLCFPMKTKQKLFRNFSTKIQYVFNVVPIEKVKDLSSRRDVRGTN